MTPRRLRPSLPTWAAFAMNVLVALVVVSLVQAFLVKLYRVPSASMEPVLHGGPGGGDWILVDRLSGWWNGQPRVGDVVVVNRPSDWDPEEPRRQANPIGAVMRALGDVTGIGPSNERYLVKRVVGVGGETIACCDALGRLERDGSGVDEPYVSEDLPFVPGRLDCTTTPRSARCFRPFEIPAGQLVLLGDHRSASADSAATCRSAQPPDPCLRTVPASATVGRVVLRVWPPHRIGMLGDASVLR